MQRRHLINKNFMRQSQLFTKTRKEAPKDEVAKNAQLLIRAGYIHKEMAGVYAYLPLGLRTLNKIVGIIREEMNAIGGQEIFMSSLQRKELWEVTDRWDDAKVDNWFKTNLNATAEADGKRGKELGLGFTHEEPITNMLEQFVSSYKDLPFSVYQFQTKFRNELRAKSGIMRAREFLMKDLYSFSKDDASHEDFYEKAKQAYIKIFERVGLGEQTYVTYASGGSFSEFSHEFQTITDAGEDTIYLCPDCRLAINKEIIEKQSVCVGCGGKELDEHTAVEVGNIFSLGTRFSEALNLMYVDEHNKKKPAVMGSYGIGPGRVMGTIVEVLADEKGLVWPKSIAPFAVHLVSLGNVGETASQLYQSLLDGNVEVLFDDRDASAGVKLADSELLGMPTRVVISPKTLERQSVEVTDRATGETELVPLTGLMARL